jgi:hypothetical protein
MFEDDLDSVADALDVMMTRAAFEAPKTGGRPPEDPPCGPRPTREAPRI